MRRLITALLFAGAVGTFPVSAADVLSWPGNPVGTITFSGAWTRDGASSVLRQGSVVTRGSGYRADATVFGEDSQDPGTRRALMIRSDSLPLSALLPSADHFLSSLFADAAPGQGRLAVSLVGGRIQSYEMTWQSRRTWMIDASDTLAFTVLQELVTDPAVFTEWDFSQFLVESCSVQVRHFEEVYSADEARRFFPGSEAEDRGEFVAIVALEGTMPAAQGMFRWLRTRVRVQAPNFPIRRVNARIP